MKFCKVCDNMLYMRLGTDAEQAGGEASSLDNISFYCRHCGNEEDNTNFDPCLYRLSYSKDNHLYYKSLINKYTPFDPTLPRSRDIPCPNLSCPTHRHTDREEQDVVYIKYNKKDMEFVYLCCKCLTAWKCPGYQQKEILFSL